MNKLKLNLSHILDLADKANLDDMDDALIREAEEIYLAYNPDIRLFYLYNEKEEPICRVKDLVSSSPSELATNDQEFHEHADFIIANTPIEDAVESFVERHRHEELLRKLNA